MYIYVGMCIDTNLCIRMGWLRFVGSLKLLVSSAEHSLFYKALLQKRPIAARSVRVNRASCKATRLWCVCVCVCVPSSSKCYGVATIRRLPKIIGLFYRI